MDWTYLAFNHSKVSQEVECDGLRQFGRTAFEMLATLGHHSCASLAVGLSAEIVVGHLVGAGRLHEAHRVVRKSLATGLILSVSVATVAALLGPWLLRGFSQDPALLAQGSLLLWWTVLLEPGRTFNLVVINALRLLAYSEE